MMHLTRHLPTLAAVVLLGLLASAARGDFTTIINVPPDAAPASIGSGTQLNVTTGGALPDGFQAGSPDGASTMVEVNMNGGEFGELFHAYAGSVVNISASKTYLTEFQVHEGAELFQRTFATLRRVTVLGLNQASA